MKSKNIILLVSSALLASCTMNQNSSTPSTLEDLKKAASAEGSKSSVRYNISGDVAFKGVYDTQKLKTIDIDNLNADINISNLSGGVLKASTDDYKKAKIYADGSVGKLDYKAYKEGVDCYASFSAYNGNANAYLSAGNLYADLSKLDLSNAIWNGKTGEDAPSKILLNGVIEAFSFKGIGFPGFEFSSTEIETYVLPLCTFSSSGNAQTASLKLGVSDIQKTYVSVSYANWVANELNSIPEDMRETAKSAAKNRFTAEIASIVPSFDLDLGLTYDSTGLYSATLKLATTISPDGANASADKKHVYTYDIDVSLNSRSNPSIPSFDASDYVSVKY